MFAKRLILSLIIVALSQWSFAAQNNSKDGIDKLVNNVVNPFMAQEQITGASIAIYYNGKEYYYNYGYADKNKKIPTTKDSIYELASITKIFVTSLLAIEVKAGTLKLSDPVVKYTPQLSGVQGQPINKVTVVQLATHTASFPRQMEKFGVRAGDVNGFFNQLKHWKPNAPIGTRYLYSNVSFGYLGYVLANAVGIPLPQLLARDLTNPLGLNHTYFDIPEKYQSFQVQDFNRAGKPIPSYVAKNFLGGGALRSSAADMMVFMKANLGIKPEGVSQKLIDALQFAQQPQFTVRPNFVLALGWQRVKRNNNLLITKNGGNPGTSTFIGFSPDKKLGVIILFNQGKSKATKLGNQLLNGMLAM